MSIIPVYYKSFCGIIGAHYVVLSKSAVLSMKEREPMCDKPYTGIKAGLVEPVSLYKAGGDDNRLSDATLVKGRCHASSRTVFEVHGHKIVGIHVAVPCGKAVKVYYLDYAQNEDPNEYPPYRRFVIAWERKSMFFNIPHDVEVGVDMYFHVSQYPTAREFWEMIRVLTRLDEDREYAALSGVLPSSEDLARVIAVLVEGVALRRNK